MWKGLKHYHRLLARRYRLALGRPMVKAVEVQDILILVALLVALALSRPLCAALWVALALSRPLCAALLVALALSRPSCAVHLVALALSRPPCAVRLMA